MSFIPKCSRLNLSICLLRKKKLLQIFGTKIFLNSITIARKIKISWSMAIYNRWSWIHLDGKRVDGSCRKQARSKRKHQKLDTQCHMMNMNKCISNAKKQQEHSVAIILEMEMTLTQEWNTQIWMVIIVGDMKPPNNTLTVRDYLKNLKTMLLRVLMPDKIVYRKCIWMKLTSQNKIFLQKSHQINSKRFMRITVHWEITTCWKTEMLKI